MLKKDIQIGGIYYKKVSGKRNVKVRIESTRAQGGWWATSMETGRSIQVKAATGLTPLS